MTNDTFSKIETRELITETPLSMNPIDPPRLLGPALGSARFKTAFEDFQVDEILGFEPTGEGEHCLAWIEKVDRNTNDVATEIAKKLGIRRRLVEYCGLKDRNATTRQWFSIHLPGRDNPTLEELNSNGVRALEFTRNLRKLRRGCHYGNRFTIRLRDCSFTKEAAARRWQAIVDRGVPNFFGPQRFGHDGGNIELAKRFMAGEVEVRDRSLRGILISATRSFIFNACVARRMELGVWDVPMDGEVFGFADKRSLVIPENLRGDEFERVRNGTLELTSPLWGEGESLSRGQVHELEESVGQSYPEIIEGLKRFNLRKERRVIRLRPELSDLEWESDTTLVLRFNLPSGTYATTVLRELAQCC
jgi:tRNA pseudouridine13 synthase